MASGHTNSKEDIQSVVKSKVVSSLHTVYYAPFQRIFRGLAESHAPLDVMGGTTESDYLFGLFTDNENNNSSSLSNSSADLNFRQLEVGLTINKAQQLKRISTNNVAPVSPLAQVDTINTEFLSSR